MRSILPAVVAAIFVTSVVSSQDEGFLIWDPDLNTSSGPAINAALVAAGHIGVYTNNLTPYLTSLPDYCAIFICLGIFPNNVDLGLHPVAVDSLVSYLANHGGRIYMEGGDTWCADWPTPLHFYFNIGGVANGSGDTDTVLGQSGVFTTGMAFDYRGENVSMDRLRPYSTAFVIFQNNDPVYNNGIAYDDGFMLYKTIGTSFEFGGLDDGPPPSTKTILADSIMNFFRCGMGSYDVGVDSIAAPPDTIQPDSAYAPIAIVRNFGTAPHTFDVGCLIDSSGIHVYGDTAQAILLWGGEMRPCTFAVWPAPSQDSTKYTMTVATVAFPDINPANDTLRKSIFACRSLAVEEGGVGSLRRPEVFALSQNSPNPANRGTTIKYQLPREIHVNLRIYDVSGRLVRALVDSKQESGYHSICWRGRDSNGRQVSSGVYFYRLTVYPEQRRGAGDPALSGAEVFTATKKMTRLR